MYRHIFVGRIPKNGSAISIYVSSSFGGSGSGGGSGIGLPFSSSIWLPSSSTEKKQMFKIITDKGFNCFKYNWNKINHKLILTTQKTDLYFEWDLICITFPKI